MADTTTPVTPPANDLQINLEEAPKEAAPAVTEPANTQPEPNLDLDLNLPEAPKNDDRLKAEDQKNKEAAAPAPVMTIEIPVVEQPIPAVEQTVEMPVIEIPVVEQNIPVVEQPVTEMKTEIEAAPVTEPATITEAPVIEEQPSTTVAEQPITQEAPAELKEDMKIIDELDMHESAWGLAPEAKVDVQPAPVAETPKTFDLDAMLGTTAEISPDRGRTEEGVVSPAPITPTAIEQKVEIPQMAATVAPTMPPAFTIPTTETKAPVSAVTQVKMPQAKTKGVKTLLFVVLFAALGFTTYFILKTMYPVEFGNMFGGNETQMHASEEVTVETGTTTEEMTWTTDMLTGEETTTESSGVTEESTNFWELSDLWTATTEETAPAETDLSRLTDYVNKGNDLLAQGKALNNNTIIKYGLYISKKATAFLEKIANGEQIDNLSWYFAQFDQYIAQLEAIITPTTETQPAEVPMTETSSPSPETTDVAQDMIPTPETTSE